jgi:subfamily B ATP-binding cassette protein MsbA
MKPTTKNILRFAKYLKPYWLRGLKATFCMVLSVLLQLPRPLILMFLIDKVFVTGNRSLLNILCLVLLISTVLSAIINFLQTYILESFKQKVIFDIELDLFQHIERLPLNYFHDKESGYLTSRITADSNSIQGLLADTIVNFLRDSLTFLVSLVVLFFLHWKLALISLMILPVFAFSLNFFSGRLRRMSKVVQEAYAIVSNNIQESISGIFIVKSFLLELHEAKRVVKSLKYLIRNNIKRNLFGASTGISSGIVIGALGLIVIWYGGYEIIQGRLTIGQFVAFNSFLVYLFGPVQRLVNLNLGIQSSIASIERIFDILDLKPEEDLRSKIKPFNKKIGILESIDRVGINPKMGLSAQKNKVTFSGVTFSYDSSAPILNDVSFTVESGMSVAIVGRSGIGKTTLVNLLPRYYEPQQGKIFIDEHEIREISLNNLRQMVGIVSQDTFLFSSSVINNIRVGKLNATEKEVVEAAKLAQAHDFILKFAKGYETKVGERGIKLSGGERQRIAIARAILKDPKILILDEATSNLDSESERLIQKAIESLMKDRTTFIIAHRLSSILNVDEIIVLEQGKIVQKGKHTDLYNEDGVYKKFYDEQFR